jgi:hypothetical protein
MYWLYGSIGLVVVFVVYRTRLSGLWQLWLIFNCVCTFTLCLAAEDE